MIQKKRNVALKEKMVVAIVVDGDVGVLVGVVVCAVVGRVLRSRWNSNAGVIIAANTVAASGLVVVVFVSITLFSFNCNSSEETEIPNQSNGELRLELWLSGGPSRGSAP